MPPRRCLDCGNLIRAGSRCDTCQRTHTQRTDLDRLAHEPWRLVYRTPAWRRARATALARDRHRCVMCGASTHVSVHHRTPLHQDGDPYSLDNLITLCPTHHAAHERRSRPWTTTHTNANP